MSREGSQHSDDSLNGSWVQLDGSYRNGNSLHQSPVSLNEGEMEDLLAEAVDDRSIIVSNGEEKFDENSDGDSSAQPVQPTTDWIWDWSSRLESHPPKAWKLRHPSPKRGTNLSIRRTKVMKSGAELFSINFYIVVPTIMVTHLVAFGIGLYIGQKMSTVNS